MQDTQKIRSRAVASQTKGKQRSHGILIQASPTIMLWFGVIQEQSRFPTTGYRNSRATRTISRRLWACQSTRISLPSRCSGLWKTHYINLQNSLNNSILQLQIQGYLLVGVQIMVEPVVEVHYQVDRVLHLFIGFTKQDHFFQVDVFEHVR